MSVIFISFVTSCVGLQGEEPQTAYPMSITSDSIACSRDVKPLSNHITSDVSRDVTWKGHMESANNTGWNIACIFHGYGFLKHSPCELHVTTCLGLRKRYKQPSPYISVTWASHIAHTITSCVRLWEEELQTAQPISFTWVSRIAACVLIGC